MSRRELDWEAWCQPTPVCPPASVLIQSCSVLSVLSGTLPVQGHCPSLAVSSPAGVGCFALLPKLQLQLAEMGGCLMSACCCCKQSQGETQLPPEWVSQSGNVLPQWWTTGILLVCRRAERAAR